METQSIWPVGQPARQYCKNDEENRPYPIDAARLVCANPNWYHVNNRQAAFQRWMLAKKSIRDKKALPPSPPPQHQMLIVIHIDRYIGVKKGKYMCMVIVYT
jgi:hypothetical protein